MALNVLWDCYERLYPPDRKKSWFKSFSFFCLVGFYFKYLTEYCEIITSIITMVTNAKKAGTGLHLLGAPVSLVSYGSSVIPIILAVWFMSYVEPFADKITPKATKMFGVPLLTLKLVDYQLLDKNIINLLRIKYALAANPLLIL